MSNSEFKKAFKGIDSAIKQGTARALNRALSSSKTKMVRALRQDTGLKTEIISSRIRTKKAKSDSLAVIMGIAIKIGVAISKFGPSIKKVKALYSDGSKRSRKGVTAKIGKQSRQLVPGAFVLDNKSGMVVVGRKAAFNEQGEYVDSKTQSKLTTLRTKIFTEAAQANETDIKKNLTDVFNDIVSHEIDYAVGAKFSENK